MANSRTISSLSDASYALSDYSDGSAPQQPSTDILSATSGGHARSQKTSRDASAGDTPNRDSTLSASDVSRRPKNQGLDLMTRLYAKPQDSEVVKTIKARHPQPPTSPKTGQHVSCYFYRLSSQKYFFCGNFLFLIWCYINSQSI